MRRSWALPLEPFYRAAVAGKNRLYDAGVLPTHALGRPVVSVGSLSAGGAGKTPFVLAVAELLKRNGVDTDVLSRGYGRNSRAVERVDAGGVASRFGDEPLELARRGLDVFVGADRSAAGVLAERTGRAALHLLDDGFQHRRLKRALDIVLLTLEDVSDHLLPAGNLREPLSALHRADVVVVRREELERLRPVIARHTRAEVWQIERRLRLPELRPTRPLVFCAIARPDGFLTMLDEQAIQPAAVVRRPDHHGWSAADFSELHERAKNADADGFLTTAKDAVKLTPAARSLLQPIGPVVIAELQVSLLDPEQVLRKIPLAARSR